MFFLHLIHPPGLTRKNDIEDQVRHHADLYSGQQAERKVIALNDSLERSAFDLIVSDLFLHDG
ncbi:MAG TPA: hypothetical protein PLD70_13060, partial [Thermotogota bacterium]|nr:hypothetical protein [Thermotogota bacterium]